MLMVGNNPENENDRGIAQIKGNLSKHGEVVGFSLTDNGLEWNPYTTLTKDMIQGYGSGRTGGKVDGALEEAKGFLEETLLDGKQRSKDIYLTAQQLGISKRTLERAKDELKIDCREREGFGKDTVVYWKLPQNLRVVESVNVTVEESDNIINLFSSDRQKT